MALSNLEGFSTTFVGTKDIDGEAKLLEAVLASVAIALAAICGAVRDHPQQYTQQLGSLLRDFTTFVHHPVFSVAVHRVASLSFEKTWRRFCVSRRAMVSISTSLQALIEEGHIHCLSEEVGSLTSEVRDASKGSHAAFDNVVTPVQNLCKLVDSAGTPPSGSPRICGMDVPHNINLGLTVVSFILRSVTG